MQIGDTVRFRVDAKHRDTLGPMADQVGIVVDLAEIDGVETLNGESVEESDTDPSLVLQVGPGHQFSPPGTYVVGFAAEDRWSLRTSMTFQLMVSEAAATAVATTPTSTTTVMDPLVLEGDKTIGSLGQDVTLPRRITTHGHALTILGKAIAASDILVTAFEDGAKGRGEDGRSGRPGQNGSGEGEAGKPGEPGGNGANGPDGADAGAVSLVASILHGHVTVRDGGRPGGRGGDGGDGGNGARGAPSRSGILDCSAGPGQGGNGGSGGRGGDSGGGGTGGRGGGVSVRLDEASPDALIDVESASAREERPASLDTAARAAREVPRG